MKVSDQLKLIQRLSGLTQERLAQELGVSFVTLNSWINGRSTPRAKAQERIDALYRTYTGQKVVPQNVLDAKKLTITKKANDYRNILVTILKNPDIRDQLTLLLTYNTNSIEGSTLTEPETAAILFDNVALPHKSLVEQLEAKNHQAALQALWKHLSDRQPIDETLIQRLHAMLMNGIRDDAGLYRRHAVRIAGANVPTANYLKVPLLMEEINRDLRLSPKDVVQHIASLHSRFEQIHPFSDGNGRIGRLLMCAMALSRNFPPPIVKQDLKRLYYAYLNKAQQTGDTSLLEDFICDAIFFGHDVIERKI